MYFLLAKFGMALFSLQPSNITLLWLPSGVGLLMCLSAGNRALPFIVLASFAANYSGMALPSPALQILHTLFAAVADCLAAWLAAAMLRRYLPAGLVRPVDLLRFALFVCIVPTLVSAGLLAGNLVLGGYIPEDAAGDFIFMLLLADSLGILLCYPLFEAWHQQKSLERAVIVPWLMQTAGAMLVIHLAFSGWAPLIFLLIPAFLYMVFRDRAVGVPLTLALAVCLVIAEAAQGAGPFQGGGTDHERQMLVFFLFSTALTVTGMWLQQRQLLARQQQIGEQNEQLVRASQAAEMADVAKSHFLANMSHELRTPLHQVLGMAQLMRREPLSDKQSNRLGRLETACRHMTSLVDAILELTRLESGTAQRDDVPIALNELLTEVASMVTEQAHGKGLQLEVERCDAASAVLGDRRLIRIALLNYANNAIRFTGSGCVSLQAKVLEEHETTLRVRFAVRDSGIGIAPEDRARLFAAFEQVDNSATRKFGGLGVGLSMTRRIAAILGGEVGCESTVGQGSTFWFDLSLKKFARFSA